MDARPPLSNPALRLLGVLRQQSAHAPDAALTDERLAALTRLPKRLLVDLAGELLEHGYLVIATCGPRPGRFLLAPDGDLAPAYRYQHELRGRAIAIMRRRKALSAAIRLAESRRSPDSTGQLSLFQGATQ